MDSSFIPGSAVQSGEFLVYDKLFGENHLLKLKLELMLVYGSLPRPPDSCSVSCSLRKFMNTVCLWFLHSLSTHNQSGTLLVDDVIALWNSLDAILVSREGELRLETLKRIIDYGTDIGWLDMLLEHLVFMFRRHMHLVSRECSNDGLDLIHHFHTLTSSSLFIMPSVGRFELLLLSVAVSLNLLDDSHNFSNCLCVDLLKISNLRHGFQGLTELIQKLDISSAKCFLLLTCLCHANVSSSIAAHVRRMKENLQFLAVLDRFMTWSLLLLSWLPREKFLFSSWMFYREISASLRQGESWPIQLVCFLHKLLSALQQIPRQWEWLMRTNHLVTPNHEDDYDFVGQGLMLCSASRITLHFPCYIGFIEEFLRFEEVFFVCVSIGCCFLDHEVRRPQELLLQQFLLHQLPRCFFTHSALHSTIAGTEILLFLLEELLVYENVLSVSLQPGCSIFDQLHHGSYWISRIWLFGWLKWFKQQTAILKLLQKQILLHFFLQEQSQDCGCPVLLQGLSREVDFIGQNFKASLSWFGSFLTFFYGSSPRPPDDRCALGVNFLKFTWSSQDLTVSSPRWKFLPS